MDKNHTSRRAEIKGLTAWFRIFTDD